MMVDRRVIFQMANRLHYQGGLSRSAALTVAWNLARAKQPEYTKVRGVTFGDRQHVLKKLARRGLADISARFQREPENPADASAVRVILVHEPSGRTYHIGYLSRERADRVAPLIDAGLRLDVMELDVTGGPGGPHYRNYGMNFAYRVAGVA